QPPPGQPAAGPPPYEIGFSTTPDLQIHSDFNLSQPDLHQLEGAAPPAGYVAPDTFAGGWQAVRAAAGSAVQLLFNGNEAGRIALDAKRQGEYEGYFCFIPDAQGGPFAVAIGTTNQNGIFVYSLPAAGNPPRLLRYFRDHNGEVLSLGVSPDGRYLVSGAEDQTIKVWSLAGLGAVSPTFSQLSVWGADFRLEGGRLVVRDVLKMGIAFGRELRDGDIIAQVRIGNRDLVNPIPVDLADPAQIIRALNGHPPWEAVIFTVNRGGQPIRLKTTVPGWEPLATLLVDEGGEWAIFTPEGYYDASVAEGHRLFGWQVNLGRNLTPRFLEAAALQKDFERPQIFPNIFALGSVFDALNANNEPIPANFLQNIADKAATVPDIKIVEPVASQKFGSGEPITIKAEFTTPPNTNPDAFTVRVTHGGRSAGEPQQIQDVPLQNGGTKRTQTFTTTAVDELNQFSARIAEKDQPIVNAVQNRDSRANRALPSDPKTQLPPKLHLLALASDNYDGVHWDTLKYPVEDVRSVIRTLHREEEKSGLYVFDQELPLFNELITPNAVDAYIEQIQRRLNPVGPKDVVLVYLSGHGKAIDGQYYYIPPIKTKQDAEVKQLAISWPQLEKLSTFRCHVIWMIDTCQSGIVTDSKSTIRSAAETGNLVVAATTGNDLAFEGDQYPDNQGNPHGAFTAFVLKGLDGEADGASGTAGLSEAEGIINVDELLAYVKKTVYRATGRNQQPCFTPTELLEVMEVQLSKASNTAN
ncbi:MAG: caspase family protein, partial [Planctomycetaceae bacterium]